MVIHIHIHCVTSGITDLVLRVVEVVGVIHSTQSEKRWTPHMIVLEELFSLSLQAEPDSCCLRNCTFKNENLY